MAEPIAEKIGKLRKRFYAASEAAVCPNMKRTNLEKILWSLEGMQWEVSVPEAIRQEARRAVDRMLETAKA